MKLENIELSFDNFASEMSKLKNQKHFDYLAGQNYSLYSPSRVTTSFPPKPILASM